jgi:hypothetical protein
VIQLEVIKDILSTNKKVFERAWKSFTKNYLLFILGIVYMAILFCGSLGASIFGPFASLIIYLIMAAVISDYLYIINQVIHNRSFDLGDFKIGFKVYLRNVYAFLFLIWVIQIGISLIIAPILPIMREPFMMTSVNWFLIILLNAIPETIYQKHYSESDTLVYGVRFIKENALEWFAPNIIIMGLLYLINSQFTIFLAKLNFSILGTVISLVLTSGIAGFAMIYRGYLYELLTTTSRRKRQFMNNMYRN